MRELYFKLRAVIPQKLHCRFYSGDITVMVGSPDVDIVVVASLKLLVMINYVTRKIGRSSILTNNNSIAVVALLRRCDKDFIIFFIDTLSQSS